MSESILNTIKKMLGLNADYTPFDTELIAHINGAFFSLLQLGVGPTSGFCIVGSDEIWSDFLDDASLLEAVKNYIHLKVRMAFDPPASGAISDVFQKQIAEYEWRLNVSVDP